MLSDAAGIFIFQIQSINAYKDSHCVTTLYYVRLLVLFSSFLGSTAQLRPWPPPQNLAEFLGGFSIIFFFTG
jgi:hypothetical protein